MMAAFIGGSNITKPISNYKKCLNIVKNISQTDYQLITRLVCVCVFVQAVTVKEALSAKGRHIRRSLSTPNVQHVRPDLPFTNVQKQNTVHCVTGL